MNTENSISKDKNVLIVLSNNEAKSEELLYVMENFCGRVLEKFSDVEAEVLSQKRIYLCGDMAKLEQENFFCYIIKELSSNYEHCSSENHEIITLGKVPIIVGNAGVYFRQLFEEDDYFNKIKAAHLFQDLTESNKPGKALRKGIYLTEVRREISPEQDEILHYHLLRCSSNFQGATDNFREIDHKVVQRIREAANYVFEQETSLNHVLAQIYENQKKEDNKESKARIKAHSDKTKDMPANGLIAFCTFYDNASFEHLKPSNTDRYDYCYKDVSGLTRLHFKLKKTVEDDSLVKEFTVVLYLNSVFFIPLSTNRLYTHEIKPSMLNMDKIPTRMGYVVRCSNAEALFVNGQAYLKENGKFTALEEMTPEGMDDLKNSYMEENQTEKQVKYGEIRFSMNLGDYQKPIY